MSPPVSERVIANAFFDNAQLSDETLKTLHQLLVSAPSSPGVITHVTSGAGAACTTSFQVEPDSSNLKTVEFSQGDSDISNSYRGVAVRFIGTDAIVTLTPQDALARGRSSCKFVLSIGDWTQPTPGFIPIKIRVPAGAPFRFRWQKLDEPSSAWRTEGPALSLLEFGSSKSNEFSTQAIAIKPLNPETGAPHYPAKLEARGSKQSPLTVQFFGINQNQLEIKASGRGRTLINGATVHVDLLQKLNEYPIPSALLAAANLALIGWVKQTFFPTRRKQSR
jgi:hypothetical protein